LIAASGLGDADGWLPVDRTSLRHSQLPTVYGIGDCATATGSKTVAAIRAQAPVVARNVLGTLDDEVPAARYDRYSACPILTSGQRVLLAEFGHNGQVMPSFRGDPRLPRRRYSWLKRCLLTRIYWRMLDGHLDADWHAPLRDRRTPLPVVKP
jgi:sulfide:quinone oxidoreductase